MQDFRKKINKLEMHNPCKHIIIDKKPVMIDFERCYFTNKPKNVTQFCQFIMSNKLILLLKHKKIKMNRKKLIASVKIYKKTYNKKDFNNILKLLKS